jgi:hypothetical protein
VAGVAGDRGLADGAGKPLCNYCGKANHLWKLCRKRLEDEKSGKSKPLHVPKALAKAKAYAAAGDGNKYPPCPTCKKRNHPADRCFFKKKMDREKEEKAHENGSSSTGAAVIQGTSVGNLLEQMLAAKLQEKITP